MKKIIFGIAVSTVFIFSSCGNSTTADKKPIADSIVKPVAKSTTDSLLGIANKTADSDSIHEEKTEKSSTEKATSTTNNNNSVKGKVSVKK